MCTGHFQMLILHMHQRILEYFLSLNVTLKRESKAESLFLSEKE